MIDEDFERAAVSWLANRGWLCQKLEPVEVPVGDAQVLAFKVPGPAEARLDRPESHFDEFWQAYPRKTGKEASRKIFEKHDLAAQGKILTGLYAHLDAGAFSPEKRYIKYPSTWLNEKCYLDDPEPRNWRKPQIGGDTPKRKALDDWLSDGDS